jgi:hypothetical protein
MVNGPEQHPMSKVIKNLLRLFFLLTVALITASILHSMV